ncbi:MAG: undecaprenyl/decaprenyl-phosphate alpha-N-acetylglucosaminyl 1-phosphate transferase [Clostridiales bacterium]|nr:undecaprenyl/decaprenyl-phosphate alpha-N-acetylglucosaminyl 1-phosphate transferase [Clostridiales bacterium]
MVHNWLLYIAAFASAFAISMVMTPFAKKLSEKLGAIDYPKARGMHNKPMPRLGGIAIVMGFMITVLVLYRYVSDINIKHFIGFIAGAVVIVCVGIVDDCKNLPAKVKLLFQIIAALLVIASGIRINVVMWPVTYYLQKLSGPITLIWIIGVTNAVNLIDGLDGLAAGVSSIASLCLMVLCILTGTESAVMLTAALAGSCLGFLPRNFNPAEIFMGDTGATFLGYVLAVTSIIGVFKGYAILALIVCLLSLGLPIFDTLCAMLRRLITHQPIMQADRGHLHHKLIDNGYTQKQAVLILYGISVLLAALAIFIAIQDSRVLAVVVLAVIVLSLVIFIFNNKNKAKRAE